MARLPRRGALFSLSLGVLGLGLLAGCASRPLVVEDRPAPDSVLAHQAVRFEWHLEGSGGEDYVGYTLQIATSLSFAAPVHEREYTDPFAEVVLGPGAYYWRVKARYRKMGDALEETDWSDMKLVEGRYIQRARIVSVLDPGATRSAAAAGPSEAPEAPPRVAPPRSGPRPGKESILTAHRQKPSLEGIDTIGVGPLLLDGKEDSALTRELILRLYELGRYTLLEQQLVDDGELRIPMSFLDSAGRPKEPPPERTRVFALHRHQPTPMLAGNAVLLKAPEAMLLVRIADLPLDPALVPRAAAANLRMDPAARVLNATLVSVKTGIILWTASLYGPSDVTEMSLVLRLVEDYFR